MKSKTVPSGRNGQIVRRDLTACEKSWKGIKDIFGFGSCRTVQLNMGFGLSVHDPFRIRENDHATSQAQL